MLFTVDPDQGRKEAPPVHRKARSPAPPPGPRELASQQLSAVPVGAGRPARRMSASVAIERVADREVALVAADADAVLPGSHCPSAGISGLGDDPAECLQGDGRRFRAAAASGVERVQGLHLAGGELEVEYVEVLGNPLGPHRLRDR